MKGKNFDKRERKLIFKDAKVDRSLYSEHTAMLLSVCLCLCVRSALELVCVCESERSPVLCVTLTAQNQHEIPQSFSADLSLA